LYIRKTWELEIKNRIYSGKHADRNFDTELSAVLKHSLISVSLSSSLAPVPFSLIPVAEKVDALIPNDDNLLLIEAVPFVAALFWSCVSVMRLILLWFTRRQQTLGPESCLDCLYRQVKYEMDAIRQISKLWGGGKNEMSYLVSEVGTGVGTLGGKTGMGVPLLRTAPPGPRPNVAWWLRGRSCSLLKDPSMSQSQPELAWKMAPTITATSLLRYIVSHLQTWKPQLFYR